MNIPPNQKLQFSSYVNWIDNLRIPFKANITITGEGPRFLDDFELDSDSLKVLLTKYGFDEKLIEEKPESLTYETKGVFVGSFGLDSVFNVNNISENDSENS